MLDFLRTPLAQAVIWTAVLVNLLVVAYWVVRKFRDRADDGRLTANQMLTNFREMHQEGDISDAEYRTIKTVLSERFRQELQEVNGTGDEG